MKCAAHIAGASVVGGLTSIAPWQAERITSMRFWMDGPEGQAEDWNGFARCFGANWRRAELPSFESLLSSLCTYARRPLVRRGLGCARIGSDVAILTTLARAATRGDLAEATMVASRIVPARHAKPAALMTAQVG